MLTPLSILADIEPVSFRDLGAFIGCVGFLLGLILVAKNLFWPSRPAGNEIIQRAELTRVLRAFRRAIRQQTSELTRQQDALAKRHEALETYTHKSIHDIRGDLQAIRMAQETQHRTIAEQIHSVEAKLAGKDMVQRIADETMEMGKMLSGLQKIIEARDWRLTGSVVTGDRVHPFSERGS